MNVFPLKTSNGDFVYVVHSHVAYLRCQNTVIQAGYYLYSVVLDNGLEITLNPPTQEVLLKDFFKWLDDPTQYEWNIVEGGSHV